MNLIHRWVKINISTVYCLFICIISAAVCPTLEPFCPLYLFKYLITLLLDDHIIFSKDDFLRISDSSGALSFILLDMSGCKAAAHVMIIYINTKRSFC